MAANRRSREVRDAPSTDDDWYPTPPSITAALLEREMLTPRVWEPACGDGAMSRVLIDHGYRVHSTDLMHRGYGEGGHDFLRATALPDRGDADWSIVTNPPFNRAGKFASHALTLNPRKLCLFVRCSFLEGQRRGGSLFRDHPPARFWVFSTRQTLWRGGDPNARSEGGAMAFAWVVWERHHRGGPLIGWIP